MGFDIRRRPRGRLQPGVLRCAGAAGWMRPCRQSGMARFLALLIIACSYSTCTTSPSASPTLTTTTLLFESPGAATTYANNWAGWYSSSASYSVSAGTGKRAAYNMLALRALTFKDDRNFYVQYSLASSYSGKTLLAIVQGCMGSDRSQSSSETKWRNGHCTIGSRLASSGVSGVSNVLRIGVGDSASGSSDTSDWALFMPLTGNGGGDYAGANVWAFGSEGRANTGYSGMNYMYANGNLTTGSLQSGYYDYALRLSFQGSINDLTTARLPSCSTCVSCIGSWWLPPS